MPHVAQEPRSAVDGRTTRHPGYAVSQQVRNRVAGMFGWMKTVGLPASCGIAAATGVEWHFLFVAAAYNLFLLRNLSAEAA